MDQDIPDAHQRCRIDLAFQREFALGGASVRPALREVQLGGHREVLEPRVMQVLVALGGSPGRTVTRDELIQRCWDGRIVGEDAINRTISKVRAISKLDGGASFRIETLPRLGYRLFVNDGGNNGRSPDAPKLIRSVSQQGGGFFGSASAISPGVGLEADVTRVTSTPGRPSIAILPLIILGDDGLYAHIAEALPHEIIMDLSRLRWLFVIARGSSFRFSSPRTDVRRVGEALGARYCLSGTMQVERGKLIIIVELSDTSDRGVVWGQRYTLEAEEVHEIRSRIVGKILEAVEAHISCREALSARMKDPENLDAWSSYHLGLHLMYQFTRASNAQAAALFKEAIRKEPTFSRAYAGLSFTHFQNAFLRYSDNAPQEIGAARQSAERAVELDPFDPLGNLVMGRSYWLTGEISSSVGWLERATGLSPNYAHGLYAQAWADMVLCDGTQAQIRSDLAMALSPLDPLHFAMLGTRAVSHLLRSEHSEAAIWADRAARAPRAHVLMAAVAVACHALNEDHARATSWAEVVKSRASNLTQKDFFASFPFQQRATRQEIGAALSRFGI